MIPPRLRDASESDAPDNELIGVSVRVFWDGDASWYEGTVSEIDWRRDRRVHHVKYADGDQQWHDLDGVDCCRGRPLRMRPLTPKLARRLAEVLHLRATRS